MRKNDFVFGTILAIHIAMFLPLFSEEIPKFSTYDEAVAWYDKQTMEETIPESTAIFKAKYHAEHQVLIVYFHLDRTKGYIHGGFPKEKWIEFKEAPSKGRYYNSDIKGQYYYKLIGE